MPKSTFIESLKRNLAALLNDQHGKKTVAPDTTDLGDGDEKQVVTADEFEYSRTAAPGKGGKIESYRPRIKLRGELLGENLTDEQEKAVRAALEDLDKEIRESDHDLHPLLPIAEHPDVRAVRAVIGNLKDEGNPTTFVAVKAIARKQGVTVTIPGDGGSVRFRKV